jgi:hypothetical protein
MPPAWSSRDVVVVLPIDTARAMWGRARRWDVEAGGRFDARSASVLIWSTNATAAESGEPIGVFFVSWRTPTAQEATVYRLEWDPTAGGSEREVWAALEVLTGHPLEAP